MIAVPLAMCATVPLLLWSALFGLFWLACPAFIVCAWWWANPSCPWAWIVALNRGVLGTQWVLGGSVAFADFPDSRAVVAAIWIAIPSALAVMATYDRHKNGTSSLFPHY